EQDQNELVRSLRPRVRNLVAAKPEKAVLSELPASPERVRVVYRRAGDKYLLVEYGPLVLDLRLRFRVDALMSWIRQNELPGIIDLTPGIRSLQIHFDTAVLSAERLLDALARAETELPALDSVEVPTRVVRLPLSWDDPATRLAIEKYTQTVRPDAPWCPSNIEFIRRINGLESIDEVYRIVFGASYLVLGLGDVYLGAPVATPIDPRHRLVTTKYNPARTWTPENAVGIGGAYLCIYGMEGPGGYQFVGRTLQVYNRFRTTPLFSRDEPWLLRFFDQIQFYPVSAAELLEMREAFLHGKVELDIRHDTFRLGDYERFLAENSTSIQSFKQKQQTAFEAERQRWVESGQLGFSESERTANGSERSDSGVPEGAQAVESHVPGSVWKLMVERGARVRKGDALVVVESMKMEVCVEAPEDGTVVELLVSEGKSVAPGQHIAFLRPEAR
ncbi:MAG TPA: carboxyltransferase domain-containing protein, partial [Polyangiaceae bacterium]|nr:carboxyltransferase domain-containing protein [Polyangiaceae bacterium]